MPPDGHIPSSISPGVNDVTGICDRIRSFVNVHTTEIDREIFHLAFLVAAEMVGLKKSEGDREFSVHATLFRLGSPWAIAGLQPDDYGSAWERLAAGFWLDCAVRGDHELLAGGVSDCLLSGCSPRMMDLFIERLVWEQGDALESLEAVWC